MPCYVLGVVFVPFLWVGWLLICFGLRVVALGSLGAKFGIWGTILM